MRGVYFERERNKYRAVCGHRNTTRLIGRFDTAYEAALAYDQKARELWGSRAITNFGEYQRATDFQLKCYKLCSPDFAGLTQRQAATILGTRNSTVCVALRRLRKKCSDLFPIYRKRERTQRYETWMDSITVAKL